MSTGATSGSLRGHRRVEGLASSFMFPGRRPICFVGVVGGILPVFWGCPACLRGASSLSPGASCLQFPGVGPAVLSLRSGSAFTESESEIVGCSVVSMDCSSSGSSVHGILQARVLEWVAIPFSRESSCPRDRTQVSRIADIFFTLWATREVTRETCAEQQIQFSLNLQTSVSP